MTICFGVSWIQPVLLNIVKLMQKGQIPNMSINHLPADLGQVGDTLLGTLAPQKYCNI